MRKLFSKISSFANKCAYAASALTGVIISTTASAQASAGVGANIGEEIGEAAASSMSSIGLIIARLFTGALLIGALVSLALAIINFMKGEREAASKLAYWFVGLMIGFALVAIIVSKLNTI